MTPALSSPDTTDTDGGRRPIRRALVSVYDKTGLEDLAQALHPRGHDRAHRQVRLDHGVAERLGPRRRDHHGGAREEVPGRVDVAGEADAAGQVGTLGAGPQVVGVPLVAGERRARHVEAHVVAAPHEQGGRLQGEVHALVR